MWCMIHHLNQLNPLAKSSAMNNLADRSDRTVALQLRLNQVSVFKRHSRAQNTFDNQ